MKIKQIPEDFIVEELYYDSFKNENEHGKYTYFILKKKNIDMLRAIRKISRIFKKRIKDISYSGMKDKNAITYQLCSVVGNISNYKDDNIEITVIGKGSRPVSLGYIKGNKFIITIRDLPINYKIKRSPRMIPNYYDVQRFGKMDTIFIGYEILKGNFKPLLEFYKLKSLNDIRKLPINEIRFFINVYNSFIFNEIASMIIKQLSDNDVIEMKTFQILSFLKEEKKQELIYLKDETIPLLGFGLSQELNKIKNLKELAKKIYYKFLEEEGINERDYIIKSIPNISCESVQRNLFINPKDFKILEESEDELNPGRKKIKLSFELIPGAYATMVIKDLFLDQFLKS